MTILRIIKNIGDRLSSYDDIVKNIGIIFSANAIVAILGLCTLMVFTHSVGVVGLGLLALIEVYPRLIDQLVRFEPSQAVIRYGTTAIVKGDKHGLYKLIKWATIFDFCGAAIAAIIALGTLHFANKWLNLSPNELQLATIFAVTLFFFVSGTSVSVMRLFSRFDLYAKTLVFAAFLRFATAIVLWWVEAPFIAFFWLIVVDALLQHIIPFVMSWRLLSREMDRPMRSIPIKGVLDENPKILRFIFNANANVLARNSTKQFDIFLLAGFVGQQEIGLYQLAKRVAMSALRVSKPIQTVVFPKLTGLWEAGKKDKLVKLVLKFNLALACIGLPIILLFLVWGDFFIGVLFGAEFKEARPLMAIQLTASTIFMSTSILNATLLSTNQDRELLFVTLFSSAVFLLGILAFVPIFGIIAASWLTLAMNVIWALGCGYFFMRITRN